MQYSLIGQVLKSAIQLKVEQSETLIKINNTQAPQK